jgi:hypothetical protein
MKGIHMPHTHTEGTGQVALTNRLLRCILFNILALFTPPLLPGRVARTLSVHLWWGPFSAVTAASVHCVFDSIVWILPVSPLSVLFGGS